MADSNRNSLLGNGSMLSGSLLKEYARIEIRSILGLPNKQESRPPIEMVLIKGRQSLVMYQNYIIPEIYRQQMRSNQSELLEFLKKYFDQDWQTDEKEWFREFVKEQKRISPGIYEDVLTYTADDRKNFLQKDMYLSLTLRLLFDFNDRTKPTFSQIWNALVEHGLPIMQSYRVYLAVEENQRLFDNEQNALYWALKGLFVKTLKSAIPNEAGLENLDTVIDEASVSILNHGWVNGLEQSNIKNRLAPNKFDILLGMIPRNDDSDPPLTPLSVVQLRVLERKPMIHVAPVVQENIHREEPTDENGFIEEFSRESKLQLADLVQAGELMYIGQNFEKSLDCIVANYRSNRKISSLINDTFIPLMYFLKRHQNLDDFYEFIFSKYTDLLSNLPIPTLSLKMLIDLLLCRSDLSLSRKILSLLSKRNPVPFIEPSMRFVPDIIHVWDYSMPTLLSFGIGICSGKSSILNQMFLSSFPLSSLESSIYSDNNIDIDFGYNSLPRRSVNIADVHGHMMKILLEQIHPLFDGFLIHIEYQHLQKHLDIVHDLLNLINQNNKYRLLIVRDVSNKEKDSCRQFLAQEFPDMMAEILPNTSDRENRLINNSIMTLAGKIFAQAPKQPLNSREFLSEKLLDLMNHEYKEHINIISRIIKPLKDHLSDLAQNPHLVSRYFPEYQQYVKLCALKLQLARSNFYGNESDTMIYNLRQRILELENTSPDQHRSDKSIYECFLDVLQAPNLLACLDTLHTELRQERARLVSTADLAMQLPIEKNLTLEVLWRNVIVSSQYQSISEQRFLQEKYYEYIQAGYPFELVDGDNFSFPYAFLSAALTPLRNQRILVISVIGPQNSGKSTLLNYMFGTLFDVRDGRCTRGIYGSLVKSNRSDFDYILLIDTEGLLGIERTDTEYDRRIVLFCLAVSHIVVVNMVGEVSTSMQDMLKLCNDSLSKMGTTRTSQAKIHFILNQRVDLNLENNLVAIRGILASLASTDGTPTIQIEIDAFHTLPSAFQKDEHKIRNLSFSIVKTAPDFLQNVQSLTGKIFDSMKNIETVDALQWLSSSFKIFDALEKSADLTYYRDIHERNLDYQIRDQIRERLLNIFSTNYREDLIQQATNKTDQDIQSLFQCEQNKIEGETEKDFNQICNLLKVTDVIRQRNRQFLRVQIYEMFNALRASTLENNRRTQVIDIFNQAEEQLRQIIENNICQGKLMSLAVAENRFEQIYQETINFIQQKFDAEKRLDQGMENIYTNYQIYEKGCLVESVSFKRHCSDFKFFIDRYKSVHELEEKFVSYFTHIAYEKDSVIVNNFNPAENSVCSLDIIQTLQYLNQHLLEEQYRSIVSPSNAVSTDQFQMSVREGIKTERPMLLDASRIDETKMYLALSKIFRTSIQRVMEAMHGGNIHDPVRRIQTELIQRIVGLITSLILEINHELNPFCLELSLSLKSVLHTLAMIVLSKYYFDEQMNHFQRMLEEFEKKKEDLKQSYITNVNENNSRDKVYASNLTQHLRDHLIKLLFHDEQEIVRQEMRSHQQINRKWIQDHIDGQLTINNDIQWYLNYVSNPTIIIESFFIQLWFDIKRRINYNLVQKKEFYMKIFKEFFFCIEGMLDHVRHLDVSNYLIDQMFQTDVRHDLNEKCQCMVELFYLYMAEQRIPSSFTVNGNVYQLTGDALRIFLSLLNERRPSQELAQVIQQIKSIYKNISIGNLIIFLESLLNDRDKLLGDINQVSCNFDTIDQNDTYARILDKVRGCMELCPCCRRPCDVDHTRTKSQAGSSDNQHRCLSGHNLRAMNGYKIEITNEPSLLMCEQIKDDQVLEINKRRYLWSNFKQYHAGWNFESTLSEHELRQLHGKFMIVWRKVGREICQRYGMKYVSDKQSLNICHQSYHYILLLDGSGSMQGTRWYDLLQAVQEFLTRRLALNTADRVTIIVFSNRINRVFFNQDILYIDVNAIGYLAGGTSFSLAFDDVYRCIEYCARQAALNPVHSRFSIVFMSDGEAEYPEYQLNCLLNNYGSVIKQFWTIALASNQSVSMNVLQNINRKMNGSFMDIKTSVDLINAYAEVASSTH